MFPILHNKFKARRLVWKRAPTLNTKRTRSGSWYRRKLKKLFSRNSKGQSLVEYLDPCRPHGGGKRSVLSERLTRR